ncbi:MAG: DUF58 domain-containing protein [Planctomycetales bacterium]|nr:DUF58 domain-containing protein [Planctomycetales bacterium]
MNTLRITEVAQRLYSASNRDFCPWANRYVYWLKEPVGWFLVALVASLLVGTFLSPLGWSVAAGLATVIALGLGFPWLATRCVRCQLRPVETEVRERQRSALCFTVSNLLPLPITGLRVEGYFSAVDNCGPNNLPADCVLAVVPAFSRAQYRLPIRPEYRGHYPVAKPQICCSFPFGIWTARRHVEDCTPVTVLPLHIPLHSGVERVGSRWGEHGPGNRPSPHGDYQGVRDFRDGDSLKSIHWPQSARNDRLVVCERGGPQQQTIDLQLSTRRSSGSQACVRENLAWRVRVAASLAELLCARHVPFRLWIDSDRFAFPAGPEGARRALELLSVLPLDSNQDDSSGNLWAQAKAPTIRIHACSLGGAPLPEQTIVLEMITPGERMRSIATLGNSESHAACSRGVIDLDQDIAAQLDLLLAEADRASFAA